MGLLASYSAELLIALGVALLIIEIMVLSFSTFLLFFIGLSLIITGSLMYIGWLPSGIISVLVSNTILTAFLAATLWKPLKRIQQKENLSKVKSDFHGHRFTLDTEIDKQGLSIYKYSGIHWQVKSGSFIAANQEVEVIDVEVGVFWVKEVK